jgi:hypothetical protein
MGQTGLGSIATHILAVKIVSGAAHFHGFGVARQGPWVTWVNKGKKTKGRGSISAHRPLFSYQPTSPKTQDTKASECCLSSYYSEPQATLG